MKPAQKKKRADCGPVQIRGWFLEGFMGPEASTRRVESWWLTELRCGSELHCLALGAAHLRITLTPHGFSPVDANSFPQGVVLTSRLDYSAKIEISTEA